MHAWLCICAVWNPNLNPSSLHPICGFNLFGCSSNRTEMKVSSKVSSSSGVGHAPIRRAAPSEQTISGVSALWVTIVPELEECDGASTSSYLVGLLQLANDGCAEEKYMLTTLLQSMPVSPLLSAPCGLSLSHASHPRHAQGSSHENGRTAIVFTWISSFQWGDFFSPSSQMASNQMLSVEAPKQAYLQRSQLMWPFFHEAHAKSFTWVKWLSYGCHGVLGGVLSARAALKMETSSERLFLPSFCTSWSSRVVIGVHHPFETPHYVQTCHRRSQGKNKASEFLRATLQLCKEE